MKHLIKTNNEQFNDALNFAEILLSHKQTEEVRVKNVDTNEEFEAFIDYDEDYNERPMVRQIIE